MDNWGNYYKKELSMFKKKNSPKYLSELVLGCAIEINNQLVNIEYDFKCIYKFTRILKEYQLKSNSTLLNIPNFPYTALWNVIKKNSDKQILQISDLALEMRLFRYELKDISTSSKKKSEEFQHLFCDLSKEFFKS